MVESHLESVCNLLPPSVFAISRPPLDIEVDEKQNILIVSGLNTENKKYLGFAVTSKNIEDETYKETFAPCLQKLVDLLKSDEDMA